MNVAEMFRLDGKNAVVTGASGAIGGAIARGFAHFGANLALCCHKHRARLDALLEEISVLPGKFRAYRVDAMDPQAVGAHADDVIRDFGSIDILVNVAGGNRPGAVYTGGGGTIFDLGRQEQMDVVVLNLFGGAIWPCLLYGGKMLGNPAGGSIINISSINGIRPLQGRAAYAAAKAGIDNFTMSLAAHIARDINPKLRVNSIAPGFFPNFRPEQMLFNEDGTPSQRTQNALAHIPMKRLGDPEELMGTALWLASDASTYVTGTTAVVDGGFLAFSGA
jgi:NAD(P)-dependent dehydrogenase (short-subunit alcohol dehydrogenase family)